jgi:hypothetical protein
MNYYDWYSAKYEGTWIGYAGSNGTIAARVASIDVMDDSSVRSDIMLYLTDTTGEEIGSFSADDDRLIYKLPNLNRFYLSDRFGLIKVVQRANHQWRYGMRHNSFTAYKLNTSGRWLVIDSDFHALVFDAMYADERQIDGKGRLLLADLAIAHNNKVYSLSGIVGLYRQDGLHLLDTSYQLLPKITEKGIEINGFITKIAPPQRDGGSGTRTGAGEPTTWEQILEQYS